MPVLNSATKLYAGTSLISKVYAGTNQVWPAAAPAALSSFLVRAKQNLGQTTFDVVTGSNPYLGQIDIWLSPKGVALNRETDVKYSFPVSGGTTTALTCGDATTVNAISGNADFSSAGPPPVLGRATTIAGGKLSHPVSNAGIMTSPDGINWTLRATPVSTAVQMSIYDIVWAGSPANIFCAVNNTGDVNNAIMTSPDGITWTVRTVPEDMDLRTVAYSPSLNRFVASGTLLGSPSAQRGLTSTDGGVTWTVITNANLAALGWNDIHWSSDQSQFVAVANTNSASAVAHSSDGLTWTRRTSVGQGAWTKITWAGPPVSKWVMVGFGAASKIAYCTNPNPSGFIAATTPWDATMSLRGLAYSPTLQLFLAVGNAGTTRIITSPDGINWTDRTSNIPDGWGPTIPWAGAEWGNGIFVITPANYASGPVCISPDGINWTFYDSPVQFWRGITYSPTLNLFATGSTDESGWADLSEWPNLSPAPVVGEYWRAAQTISDFVTGPNNPDATLRMTGGGLAAEDVLVSSTANGFKMNRRLIAYVNTRIAAGIQPSGGASFDDVVAFKETPTCIPQGEWDAHAFPVNIHGIEGPESTVLAITVI